MGRTTTITHLNGLYITSRTYGCCGLLTSTDRTGASTEYMYDALRRVTARVRRAATGATPIIDFTSYDGLTTTNTRYDGVNSLFLSSVLRSVNGLTTTSYSPDADYTGNAKGVKRKI